MNAKREKTPKRARSANRASAPLTARQPCDSWDNSCTEQGITTEGERAAAGYRAGPTLAGGSRGEGREGRGAAGEGQAKVREADAELGREVGELRCDAVEDAVDVVLDAVEQLVDEALDVVADGSAAVTAKADAHDGTEDRTEDGELHVSARNQAERTLKMM